MNSVIKKLKRPLREAPFTSRISGGALALLSISVLLFSATAANAACGLTGTGSKSSIRLPMLAQAGNDQDEGAHDLVGDVKQSRVAAFVGGHVDRGERD